MNAQSLSSTAQQAATAQPVTWDDGLKTPDLLDATFANTTLTPADAGATRVTAVGPQGVVSWTSTDAWFGSGAGAIDRLRVTSGSAALAPGAPVWLNPSLGDQIFDVSYTRGWPQALSLRSRGYGVDVTPHAGLGLTSAGESAEAGATVRFGAANALDELGIRGQPGHWYFYAQSSGRAVGYNLIKGEPNFRSANLFTQTEPGFLGDSEAGVAWRRGDVQASFGYTERSIHLSNMRDTDVNTRESVIGFTFSFRPGRR
ncbi:MAG TPA: lipid A-modifier LpxR family protein [Caulobacteraceae bacterium]|nr:lipid A-modifier LpxR family protein [Caulobacteraceae bacterium]